MAHAQRVNTQEHHAAARTQAPRATHNVASNCVEPQVKLDCWGESAVAHHAGGQPHAAARHEVRMERNCLGFCLRLGLQLCRTWRSLSATWNAGVHLRCLAAAERNAGANNGEWHRGHLAQSVTQNGRRVRAWVGGWGAGVTSEVSACCAPSAEVRKSVSETENEYGDGRRARARACDRAG